MKPREKMTELRKMTVIQLGNEVQSLLKEQFNLRMQKGTEQLTKFHLLSVVRKNMARAKFVLAEKRKEGKRDE